MQFWKFEELSGIQDCYLKIVTLAARLGKDLKSCLCFGCISY